MGHFNTNSKGSPCNMPQEAQRQNRGTVLLILNLTPRCEVCGQRHASATCPWKTTMVSTVKEVWLASRPAQTIVKKTKPLASTGVQPREGPACSKLPYNICSPSPTFNITTVPKIKRLRT